MVRALTLGIAAVIVTVATAPPVSAQGTLTHDGFPIKLAVVNSSSVCQRFAAQAFKYDMSGMGRVGGNDVAVGPHIQYEVHPHEKAIFELHGQAARVWASPHESSDCTSRSTGSVYTDQVGQSSHLTFDGAKFTTTPRP